VLSAAILPLNPSLFVEIRKRLGDDLLSEMNLRILQLSKKDEEKKPADKDSNDDQGNSETIRRGELLMDASVSPQDIAYPTDLNLLNKARQVTEQLIDFLHSPGQTKPRTYRQKARKNYLNVAQNRNPSRKTIRKAIGKQLRYLRMNISHTNKMLDTFKDFPLPRKLQKQFWVVQTLYDQQLEMFTQHKHSVNDRIVSIHQPHVRPMVRGKAGARIEFGSKLHLSMVDGFAFVDIIRWDAFNEGTHLSEYVENYRHRFGFYPEKVLVDKIYCTRANRRWLKERQIKLAAKPLGRPSAQAVEHHVRPGERNPIEGKFGQAKNGYGMNRIRARLKQTSQSWVASIILVLNLVKLAKEAPSCLSFSAQAGRLYRHREVSYLKSNQILISGNGL
jgi:IS5 family transposase